MDFSQSEFSQNHHGRRYPTYLFVYLIHLARKFFNRDNFD